jgi:hypothetical protein
MRRRSRPQASDALTQFVTHGGGLLIALGDRLPWNGAELPLLPGKPGASVDRLQGGGSTLGHFDYSHPIFDDFKEPRNGNFSSVRFFKSRGLTPAPTDKVLVRYDDGAAAIVERTGGQRPRDRVHLDAEQRMERFSHPPSVPPVPA